MYCFLANGDKFNESSRQTALNSGQMNKIYRLFLLLLVAQRWSSDHAVVLQVASCNLLSLRQRRPSQGAELATYNTSTKLDQHLNWIRRRLLSRTTFHLSTVYLVYKRGRTWRCVTYCCLSLLSCWHFCIIRCNFISRSSQLGYPISVRRVCES